MIEEIFVRKNVCTGKAVLLMFLGAILSHKISKFDEICMLGGLERKRFDEPHFNILGS